MFRSWTCPTAESWTQPRSTTELLEVRRFIANELSNAKIADRLLISQGMIRSLYRDGPIDGQGCAARKVVVTVRIYTPQRARDRVVTYLHGGGWVIDDLDTHDPVCRRVANALGAVVVSVDYRLASEHPHPAPLHDTMVALAWVAARYPDRRT